MGKTQYIPVSATDEKEDESGGIDWNSSSEIIPSNTKAFIGYLSILLISLAANVLLILHNPPQVCGMDLGKTPYSGNTFDTVAPYYFRTDYWDPTLNQTNLDENWDALDTNPMAVALHNDYIEEAGLSPSTTFPWDSERSVYYLKGFHSLHCLKLIRKAITAAGTSDISVSNSDHIFHCLDGLRQDIMCVADDTPIPATAAHAGDGQLRRCRSWDKMTEWATAPERHACHQFDDYMYREATDSVEFFSFCPQDSPYRPAMDAYFQAHGHKDPYQVKMDGSK